jgi:hypothetical protein
MAEASGKSSRTSTMNRGIIVRDSSSTVGTRRSGPIVLDVRAGNIVSEDHERSGK